jgi:anaerobic ribonucleoside-triphosphate reductase activating protein
MAGRTDVQLNLARLAYPVTALGFGNRIAIWFQGCSIHCPGCMSKDTWEANDGRRVALKSLEDRIAPLVTKDLDGVTISGGEPFEQPAELFALLRSLRTQHLADDQDILLFSGFRLPLIRKHWPEILELADALISGPFVRAAGSGGLWQGSANQVLTKLTPLGEARYESGAIPPDAPSLQMSIDDDRVWIIGVPRVGDLQRMQEELTRRGIELGAVSWR